MSKLTDYPFDVRPLSTEEGGGYLIAFPDLAECISDGESVDEAIVNGHDALKATIAALKSEKLPAPAPIFGISIKSYKLAFYLYSSAPSGLW